MCVISMHLDIQYCGMGIFTENNLYNIMFYLIICSHVKKVKHSRLICAQNKFAIEKYINLMT